MKEALYKMNNENIDDTANKGTEQVKKVGKGAGKKAFSAAKKALAFLIKKLLVMLGISIPVVLGFMVLVAIIGSAFYFGSESRGTDQEFEYTSAETENQYSDIINEYGDPDLVGLSEENAFLQIFYENEVEDSYWKYYLDKNGETVLDYGNNTKPFNPEVKDKYGREKYFQLNAMSLYALDEYLNNNDASTPQTFIQHVPFKEIELDDGEVELEGIDLTDDKGELTIKSQDFKVLKDEKLLEENEGVPTYRRKYDSNSEPVMTEGVWDFGLAPVYHYLEFEEKRELRNEVTGGETWDTESQQMRKMTMDELSSFGNGGGAVPDTDEESTEMVFLIKDAVTPMGTIKNEIEQIWQESGKVVTKTYNVPQSVQVKKTHTIKVPKDRGDANWRDDVRDNSVRPMSNDIIIDQSTGGYPSSKPDGDTDTGTDEVEYEEKVETYYETEVRDRQIEVKGVEWEYIPRYVGEPDTDDLDALGYYIDYFGNYDNYVDIRSFKNGPFTYLETAKLQEELGIQMAISKLNGEAFEYDEEELGFTVTEYGIPPTVEERQEGEGAYIEDENGNRITKPEHPLMKSIRELQLNNTIASGPGEAVDLEGVEFASESDSQAVQNASRYLPQFTEYGNRYGIDPMLLVAIAAVETGGNHEQTSGQKGYNGVRRSYLYKGNGYADKAAIGLMQLLPSVGNPTATKSVSAFNHETGAMETFKANQEELHDLENNIKFATMQLASEMRAAKHDVLVGVTAYHFGVSYAVYINKESTPYNTWSPESIQGYYDYQYNGKQVGTRNFVERVLARYLPTADSQFPWVLNHEGEKKSPNISGLEMPNGELANTEITQSVSRVPSGSNNKAKESIKYLQDIVTTPFRAMSTITGWIGDGVTRVAKWFNLTETLDTRNYYRIGTNAKETAANDLFLTMLAYDEGLHLSDYAELDEEELIELMLEKYMKNLREQDNIGMNIDPEDYFKGGFTKPVDKVNIVVKYGDLKRGDKSQLIQLAVPGSTKIYAVADGTIKEIGEHSVSIDHGNGVATVYEGLGKVLISKMKIGDEISEGTVIATGASNTDDTIEKDAFAFGLYKNGKFEDPTWIVDPSVLTQGGNIDPNSTSFIHPFQGRQWAKTSNFGWRIHPITGVRTFHDGTDYAGLGKDRRTNMDILAPADGKVVHARYTGGLGNAVVLEHPQMQQGDGRKVYTVFAHMVRNSPHAVGTIVKQGQKIGNEGTTGNSTGDHLHLELIIGHGNTWSEAKGGRGASANLYDFDAYLNK